jgi:two-component system, NarL family, sensor histidine kinase UhpB
MNELINEDESMELIVSVTKLINDISGSNDIKIVFESSSYPEERSDAGLKLVLYRIIREQLNNVLKHAKATEVTINLSQNKKLITLSIFDNGVGFDTTKKSNGTGLGNIISRAKLYNGKAIVISQPGEGCSLIASFPC